MKKVAMVAFLPVCCFALCAVAANAQVDDVLDRLSVESYGEYMAVLAPDNATRYSCTEDILTARDNIVSAFEDSGYSVQTPGFDSQCEDDCFNQDGFNVVAIKAGETRPEEYYLVGAHYDSMNEDDYCGVAPGAADNASGVAGVLELARVFADVETEASLIFVAFGGEEIDLLGSRQLVDDYDQSGMLDQLLGFINLDMISYWGDNYAMVVESSDESEDQEQTAQQIAALAEDYTDLDVEIDFEYADADHAPFLDMGVPGALLISKDWEAYEYYHTAQDVMSRQDMDFGLEVVRAGGAALATWSMTDQTPGDDDDDDDDDDEGNGCGC